MVEITLAISPPYDLTVTVDSDASFAWRIAGHVENGEDSMSDPAIDSALVQPLFAPVQRWRGPIRIAMSPACDLQHWIASRGEGKSSPAFQVNRSSGLLPVAALVFAPAL